MTERNEMIFVDAAMRITEDHNPWNDTGCCEFIDSTDSDGYDEHDINIANRFFSEITRPSNDPYEDYWYGEYTEENQLARTLALLFCAEIYNDERYEEWR